MANRQGPFMGPFNRCKQRSSAGLPNDIRCHKDAAFSSSVCKFLEESLQNAIARRSGDDVRERQLFIREAFQLFERFGSDPLYRKKLFPTGE